MSCNEDAKDTEKQVPGGADDVHVHDLPGQRSRRRFASGAMCTRLSLLGTWRLADDGRIVVLPASARRLIALLALNGAGSRPYLAGTLWPEGSDALALGNLRQTVSRLGKLRPDLIVAEPGILALAPSVVVDVHDLLETADLVVHEKVVHPDVDQAKVGPDRTGPDRVVHDRMTPEHLGRGHRADTAAGVLKTLVQADLLPGWYDDWVLMHRERIRHLRLHALEAFADQLRQAGWFADAVDAALAAVQAEPLRESAHRALIRVHLAEGNRGEAVRQYLAFRELLRTELGVDPSPLMASLVEPTRAVRRR